MKKILIILIWLLFLFVPTLVLAHPGRTDAYGCHTCRTNCSKWGLATGQYHCHGGSSKSSSSNNSNNSSKSSISSKSNNSSKSSGSSKSNVKITKEKIKSSDNTLKSIIIDEDSIRIGDTMRYNTYNENVDIKIKTNDSKAKFDFKNRNLNLGNNTFIIKVTAENGNIKYYTLVVNREKLSDNTNIIVKINDKNINFNGDNASIDVSSDTEDITYEVKTEDNKAKVDAQKEDKLNFGSNIIVFKVTAQDGSTRKYQVNINRLAAEEKKNSDGNKLLGVIILAGVGLFTYSKYKKINK